MQDLNKDFPLPECLFFLNVSPKSCMKRIQARGEALELFEKEVKLDVISYFYKKVLEEYKDSGMKIVVIDGTQSIEAIHEEIMSYFKENKSKSVIKRERVQREEEM